MEYFSNPVTPQTTTPTNYVEIASMNPAPQESFTMAPIGTQPPTQTPANYTASQAIGTGVQAGTQLVGGALQARAMNVAGDLAQAESMEALDQIEKDARIDRALQTKARKLQMEQDTYRRMNENIGMRIQTFQRTLADKLDKASQTQRFADKLRGSQGRDAEIQDVKLQQMGDM